MLVDILASFSDQADPLDEQRHQQWAQTTLQAFAAMALPGGYPKLLGGGNPERAAKSYGPNASRLIMAKRYSAITLPTGQHMMAAE